MNSAIKIAVNVAVEWNQSCENSNRNKEDIQYLKAKLGKSL